MTCHLESIYKPQNQETFVEDRDSVGGWSFNNAGNAPDTRTAFSDMASSATNRQAFIASLTQFMKTYNFDGVDIDW